MRGIGSFNRIVLATSIVASVGVGHVAVAATCHHRSPRQALRQCQGPARSDATVVAEVEDGQ